MDILDVKVGAIYDTVTGDHVYIIGKECRYKNNRLILDRVTSFDAYPVDNTKKTPLRGDRIIVRAEDITREIPTS